MARALTTQAEFITRAQEKHGSRYDYTHAKYTGQTDKVKIICRKHGEFLQTPKDHMRGRGCPSCNRPKAGIAKRLTPELFIDNSKAKHGDKYDYSLANYIRSTDEVIIVCPDHGQFRQTPKSHMRGSGCPACGGRPTIDTAEFVSRSRKQHGDTYDYSQAIYVNQKTMVTIICRKHGAFEQLPHNHMRGVGCKDCGLNSMADQYRSTAGEFEVKAIALHGDKYDYSEVEYETARKDVTILCPTHGAFQQSPYSHLVGRGCPSCAESGFDIKKPAILYYLRVEELGKKPLYKIGITNRSVVERFNLSEDKARIKVLASWEYALGKEALDRETDILRKYKSVCYKGPDILKSGNTEMFNQDILGLDDSDDSN